MPHRPGRFLIVVLLLTIAFAVVAHAAILRTSKLGPSSSALTVWNNSAITADQARVIVAASTGQRNCLSKMSFVATTTATVRILDGGTTVYAIDLAAAAPLYELWGEDDMCGAAATALTIKVSTAVRATPLGSQSLNTSGFTY